MNNIKKILTDLFTGIDGQTHDISRWLWFIGVFSFLGFTGYEVYKNGHFDMVNYGMAYAALLGGGGVACKVKESTEPGAIPVDTPK